MTITPMTIKEAKERVRIPDLWRILNITGRAPRPVEVIRSPFRDDSRESFSVFADGKRFKDHGTGEGGDAISFYAMARGIENREAVKEFINLASNWR